MKIFAVRNNLTSLQNIQSMSWVIHELTNCLHCVVANYPVSKGLPADPSALGKWYLFIYLGISAVALGHIECVQQWLRSGE